MKWSTERGRFREAVGLIVAAVFVLGGAACQAPSSSPHLGVTPHHAERFFWDGGDSDVELRVNVSGLASRPLPLDILFLFDRTNSMTNVIGTMQREAGVLLATISATNPNSRFGVGLVADYPLYSEGTPSAQAWLLASNLSSDPTATTTALDKIETQWGGDLPEAYVRGLHEAAELSWRPEAQKFVILFGDAPAHDVAFYSSAGVNMGADPGRDGILQTADDLTMDQVLAELRAAGVVVATIYEEQAFWESKPYFKEAVDGLQRIASSTGGVSKSVSDASEIPAAIGDAIRESYVPVPLVIPAPERDRWAQASELRPVAGKEGVYTATVRLHAPSGTRSAKYEIPIQIAYADDPGRAEVGRSTIVLRVGILSYGLRLIAWSLGTLLLLLLLILRAARAGMERILSNSRYWWGFAGRAFLFVLLGLGVFYLGMRLPEAEVVKVAAIPKT